MRRARCLQRACAFLGQTSVALPAFERENCWRSWGLETSAAAGADLDGDGTNEFLFETPKDGGRRLWVVYRKNGRWLVDDSFHRRVGFGGIVALPKGNAIKVTYEHTGPSAPES